MAAPATKTMLALEKAPYKAVPSAIHSAAFNHCAIGCGLLYNRPPQFEQTTTALGIGTSKNTRCHFIGVCIPMRPESDLWQWGQSLFTQR